MVLQHNMTTEKYKVLVCWDYTGLDIVFDLTQWEKECMWALLTGDRLPTGPDLRDRLHKSKFSSSTNVKFHMYSFMTDLSELDIRHLWKPTSTRKKLIKMIKTTGVNFAQQFYSIYI